MDRLKRLLSIILAMILYVLIINFAYASSFDLKITPIKDKIPVEEVAEFKLTIQNNIDSEEEFIIRKVGYPYWDMYTKPLQNPITLKVPANGSESINIFVDPLYITVVDTYTLPLGVGLERTGEEQKVPISIGIKSIDSLISGYVPTVLASVSISPEDIDPRKETVVKIVLNNQNILDYPDLKITMVSNLFNDEIHTTLAPKEDKVLEFTKKMDHMTVPQQDKLVVAISRDGKIIVNPIIREFKIKSYEIKENLQEQRSFLKVKKGVRILSNDAEYEGTIKLDTNRIKNMFLTSSPSAEIIKEGGKQYLYWKFKVGSDKIFTVETTENYRPIVVVSVLVILSVILYFLLRSPIVLKKSVVNLVLKEGGVSEVKAVVRVKNRSGKKIDNIEVLDFVPGMAYVEKEVTIGSIQPDSLLKHPKKGVTIKWIIENLDAGDERVLSYKIRFGLSVLGEFNLPSAVGRCKVGHRFSISNSNRVGLSS